jgi:hypothetical protein
MPFLAAQNAPEQIRESAVARRHPQPARFDPVCRDFALCHNRSREIFFSRPPMEPTTTGNWHPCTPAAAPTARYFF